MASKLADEILQMILAPSLTVPQVQFQSPSPVAFGDNEAVTSAYVLLVCKRWLRVATPLLYETVILRSTGQTQALADVLHDHPEFSLHIKKIRLEGAYSAVGNLLTRCTSLITLVILLRVYSDASAASLCRALSQINPKHVILHDEGRIDNTKIRQVFIAICDAIPQWKRLISFHYPYHLQGQGNAKLEPNVTRRDRLIKALTHSKTLSLISCEMPPLLANHHMVHFDHLLPLARIPSITMRFVYSSSHPRQAEMQSKIVHLLSKHMQLPQSSFDFADISGMLPSRERMKSVEVVPLTSFTRISAITEKIWMHIFAFATLPSTSVPSDGFYANSYLTSLHQFEVTRKALSLTCKMFERLVRPMFYAYPLMFSPEALHEFAKKICQTPDLGRRVRVLSLAGLLEPCDANEDLCNMLPHLVELRHFIGSGALLPFTMTYANPKTFLLLAEAAGDSLLTITGLEVRNGDIPVPVTILKSFKKLVKLDLPSPPRLQGHKTQMEPEWLHTLRELRLDGFPNFLDMVQVLRLPHLRRLSVHLAAPPILENFMRACGSQVEELFFRGTADLSEVFSLAPKLYEVVWEPHSMQAKPGLTISAALSPAASHEKLELFIVKGILDTRSGEKEHAGTINAFFDALALDRFPSLQEIRFPNYVWPVEERAISRDCLPNIAMAIKLEHGVEVTDRSRKPWRPRVQRRR